MRRRIRPALANSAACALALSFALAACKPSASGRCGNGFPDCPADAFCSSNGVCVPQSGNCHPACASGEICSISVCVALKPAIAIQLGATEWLSPTQASVTVAVVAASQLTLGSLAVTAMATISGQAKQVARGVIITAVAGLNKVTLDAASFAPGVQQQGTLVAVLTFPDESGDTQTVQSAPAAVGLDSLPPLLNIAVPVPADAVNGFVARSGADLLVTAQLTDQGSGPASASLQLDACPVAGACTFAGLLEGPPAQGVGSFGFHVPRTAQAAGAETPLAFHLHGLDASGNETVKTGALNIDDRPPLLGSPVVVTAGFTGEDHNIWFPGAAHPQTVTLALAASDLGAGVDSNLATLTLRGADLTPAGSAPDVVIHAQLPPGADGTLHFKVDTSVVSGREGPVHYVIEVRDRLQHASTLGPSGALVLHIDDVPPTVTLAHVDYTSSTPDFSAVCGRADSVGCTAGQGCSARGFHCGRGASQASANRLLRDDTVTVYFDAVDCGAGVDLTNANWTAESGPGHTSQRDGADTTSASAGACSGGTSQNLLHHFKFTFQVAVAAPLLDAPLHSDGTTRVRLAQRVLDLVGAAGASPAATVDGDGIALVSLVRWRAQLGGTAVGDPSLLPAANAPRVLVAASSFKNAPDGGDGADGGNLTLLDQTGAEVATATIDGGIAGDVAVGQQGTLYMPGAVHDCAGTPCSEVEMAASDGGTLIVLESCTSQLNATFGAPVALTSPDSTNGGLENVIAVPTAVPLGGNDFLAYMPIYAPGPKKCVKLDERLVLLPNNASPTGVSVFSGGATEVFASHAAGFSSVSFDGSSFSSTSVDYNGTAPLYAPAAPSLEQSDGGLLPDGGAAGAPVPLFGVFSTASLDGGSAEIRSAHEGTCAALGGLGMQPCWLTDATNVTTASIHASHTPLFAGGYGFVTDDSGAVRAFNLATGDAVGTTTAAGVKVSPPLLLGDKPPPNNALVAVQANGLVGLGPLPTTATNATLPQFLTVGSFLSGASGRPPTPVADKRGTGSVIYVIDGGCAAGPGVAPGTSCGPSWIWALQSDAPPLAASSTAWVRPGRDSCNTRNAQAACP